jgi:hypothetical protein
MRAVQVTIAIALLLMGPSKVGAADPSWFEVMGVRLNMTSAEAITVLRRQTKAMNVQDRPCKHDPLSRCVESIVAELPDGSMTVRFTNASPGDSKPEIAYSIVLSLKVGGRSADTALRTAAIEHYGPPTASEPMTWCVTSLRYSNDCDPDQPIMRLEPGGQSGVIGVLSLAETGLTRNRSPETSAALHFP